MSAEYSLTDSRAAQIRFGAIAVAEAPAVFRFEGAGALTCLQGLLTNDLVEPGDGSLVFGAVLTAKGAIVFDTWVLRQADGLTLVLPSDARASAADLFRRTIPPRLAKVRDQSDEWSAAWFLGTAARERMAQAIGTVLPAQGRVIGLEGDALLATAPDAAPFRLALLAPTALRDQLMQRFLAAGGTEGDPADLALAQVLSGWPSLGREIDERTLPQEVRFDELGGVSYTKGCYTGQETVARVHFRGHVNRSLRGLEIEGSSPVTDRAVTVSGKEVGRVGTAIRLDGKVLALAVLRREVESGTTVGLGPRPARVVPLPFLLD